MDQDRRRHRARQLGGPRGGRRAARLIGIPSRVQCGASLFKSCNSLDDVQGKIRPVALALPVIRAAEAGKPWKEHYLVQGTGREKLDFLGWGSTEPDSTCRAQRVPANGTVKRLYAVYDASGMTPGEDIDYIVGYRHDSSSAASYDQSLDTWPKGEGTGDRCFWYRFGPNSGAGIYSLDVLAGPSLRQTTNEAAVRVAG